jgi:hypothetical protein
MRKFIIGAAALIGLAASTQTASAQHNRNVISNSGNGINNTVIARNGPSFGSPVFGFPGGGVNKNVITNSGNGIGNTVIAQNGGGFPHGGGFPGNGGFFPGGGFPGGGVFPGGVNVNVITNSGNGVGNTVLAGNSGRPGGLNINVITNSGNGVGNVVSARNR